MPEPMRAEPVPTARPGALRAALSTLTTILFALPGTVVMASLAILSGLLPPRGRHAAVMFCARIWSRGLLAAAGVRMQVEVDPALEPRRGYVYLANHQSYFDIPSLLATVPGQLRFAAKRSLFWIPIFGWSLAVGGFIPVDREDRSQARNVFAAAGRLLRAGISVLFFPEGTRSPDGRLLPFQRGGFLVAIKGGVPIVPVGIAGAREVLPRDPLIIRPGTIRLRYGRPIETTDYGLRRKGDLVADVRRCIGELAGAVEVEGSGGEKEAAGE